MKITFAPWFAGDGENALQTILKAADGIPDEIQSQIRKNAGHCAFQSCLHLRRHCDLCTHAFQEKEAGGHGEG